MKNSCYPYNPTTLLPIPPERQQDPELKEKTIHTRMTGIDALEVSMSASRLAVMIPPLLPGPNPGIWGSSQFCVSHLDSVASRKSLVIIGDATLTLDTGITFWLSRHNPTVCPRGASMATAANRMLIPPVRPVPARHLPSVPPMLRVTAWCGGHGKALHPSSKIYLGMAG